MTANNLRIAVLVRRFPNIVQTYVLNHIISLKKVGVDTVIIAERDPKQKEIHPRVHEYRLLEETEYINVDSGHYLEEFTRLPFFNLRYIKIIMKILFSPIWTRRGLVYGLKAMLRGKMLSAQGVDIIHSHSLFSTYSYLFLKEIFSIPLSTTFHGLIPKTASMLDPDKTRAVMETCDVFFVNTRFAEKQLTGLGCSRDKIHIIPQGTNLVDFPYKERHVDIQLPVVVLSVGRLSVEKGFHIGIRAIASLVGRYPNLQYRIVGGGNEKEHLEHLIKDLGVSANVEIFGSVSTSLLQKHYSEAHIFMLPSIDFRDGTHTETQGVVLQEAQASGIPVIASRTGGIPEVVKDRETGLLFTERNEAELSNLIETLITDETGYQSLCRQAFKDIRDHYSIEYVSRRMIRVYQSIL